MSISNAMQTGVSGLLANSSAVGHISSNIANANTDGYRRTFAQMVTTAPSSGNEAAGTAGVRAASRSEISVEGTPRTTGIDSDLAISGEGFFVVTQNANETEASNFALTRAGSFTVDQDGNLRNAAGLYLSGFEYDEMGLLGAVDRTSFNDLTTVNVSSAVINGEATTAISASGNLPAQQTGATSTQETFVTSQEYYTALGGAEMLEFAWTPSTTPNQWQLELSAEGTALGSVDVTFADSGATAGSPASYTNVTSTATAPAAFAFDATTGTATLTINNGTTPQQVTIELGAPGTNTGMTQFAGDYTPVESTLDGFESGQLVRFEIDESGDLYGVFDNSARRLLYNIPLAEVTNPDGLRQVDGNAYIPTQSSGDFQLNTAGTGTAGSITAGALEASNVELAEELTMLIQTQRAYSSNAKIITTVDQMMEETTALKR
ncbi:flagellar hook protein [Pseudooceanicola lipolyticus]|uniref:Flagellar hook protein FlgE n=1 Tax=Pseudooceanicola lipolyticus TaxID=2029104 RepID=A0A2M8IXE0_9RHOB|nr:flagellar hook-basal body complex protein [Pseudooceanicola lipolyticus]PJE35201.1 flagellar hook protein [Pseudooceanicola lipolyticus]